MALIAIREHVVMDRVEDLADQDALPLNEEERQRLLSESAKLRAAARRQYKTVCRECGKEIVGLTRKKFCRQTCQRAHWRRRLKEMNPGDELPVVE